MNKQLENIMNQLALEEKASKETIAKVENELNWKLPDEYKQFLLYSNGAEGEIGIEGYVVLWKIEELIPLNKEYSVEEFTPGLFYFGSDGADMAYGFDLRDDRKRIIRIPFDSIHIEEAENIAETFDQFLIKLSEG